ncbi:hypothetical protein [Ideonella paludis]|uniref:hypothetical protein n=1 Tax=Ideonella paludis TaxID=1233411 RepID=UPI00364511BB
MRNRPLSHKVGALVVAMVLPLLLLLVLEWQQHQRLIEFSRKELQGLAVVERVADVATHVERLRGAVAAAAARDPNAAAPVAVDVHAKALTQSAQALRAAVANGELADLSKEVDLALQPVARLTQDPQSMARQQFEASHSRAAASLKDFNLRVAERAGLLFDPDAQSYFLMDMLVERLLVLLESSGRSTAATLGVLSTTEASPADRERALALLQHTREHLLHVRGRLEALRRSGGELPGQWPDSYRQVDESAQLARAAVSGETHAADPKEVAAAGGRALHAVELLHAELLRELRGLLEARVQQEGFMQLVSTLLVVLAVLLSSTIAWVFFRSFVGSTKALVRAWSWPPGATSLSRLRFGGAMRWRTWVNWWSCSAAICLPWWPTSAPARRGWAKPARLWHRRGCIGAPYRRPGPQPASIGRGHGALGGPSDHHSGRDSTDHRADGVVA